MFKMTKNNEQGFTFVEILTCLAIVALIVGPICFSFLSSLKTRVTAESINEATAYAERLLEDVKVQMADDIILRQKMTGNRINTTTYSGDITIAKEGVGQYLIDLPGPASTRTSAAMTSFFKGNTSADINSKYNTDDYAYEVALWRMNDIPFNSIGSDKTLTLNESTINKATKLYTDSSAAYQFDTSKYTGLANPITFKITDEMLKAFQDKTLAYVPNQASVDAAYKIMDKNIITLKKASILTTPPSTSDIVNWRKSTASGNEAIKIDAVKTIKKNDGTVAGYIFNIVGGTDVSGFASDASKYRSIIELDVRELLRKEDLSPETAYDHLTFKFINNTAFDQLIFVRQNVESGNLVNGKFNIVAEDATTGKSSIVRVDDINAYENYIIAVIVREKAPALGEQGKIVKKLIDIFSYDVTTNQRR